MCVYEQYLLLFLNDLTGVLTALYVFIGGWQIRVRGESFFVLED